MLAISLVTTFACGYLARGLRDDSRERDAFWRGFTEGRESVPRKERAP